MMMKKIQLIFFCFLFAFAFSKAEAAKICQCDKNGHQIECDESKNTLGASQCASDCHCSKGNRCKGGKCVGVGDACCDACTAQAQTCQTLCNSDDPSLQPPCYAQCDSSLAECQQNCPSGCPSPENIEVRNGSFYTHSL